MSTVYLEAAFLVNLWNLPLWKMSLVLYKSSNVIMS